MAAGSSSREGRPMCRPSSRARRMPARTRSMMRLRSSSAMAPMMTTTPPAQRAAGVDLLAEADELDVQPVELIQHIEEVSDGAGDSVRGPDQHDVEAVATGVAHQVVETRPAGPGAADRIGVLLNDLIPALLSHLTEVIELGL